MDWSNLRYFLALARSGSLSAASKVLGTDHTTVARRVQALEKELGLQLVDRRVRAYSLTPSGQRIYDLAARVETAIADVERFAQSVTRTPQGPVRISGPSSPTFELRSLARRAKLPSAVAKPTWRCDCSDLVRTLSSLAS